jgi:hypothetical protein
MFIDKTYFTGSINLPGSALDGTYAVIANYITQYEKKILIKLLGYTLYKELVANYNASSGKWYDFINGVEYTVGDYTVKWNGLINSDKISLLAYFTYFHFVRDNVTSTSVIGEILNNSENSTRISPADKQVHAWNQGLELYGRVSDHSLTPSAYNYLKNHTDDFPLWVFTELAPINAFEI